MMLFFATILIFISKFRRLYTFSKRLSLNVCVQMDNGFFGAVQVMQRCLSIFHFWSVEKHAVFN